MKKKKPSRDYHHLLPRARGGQDLSSNLILIKITRHRAWHKLWGNRTLKEIINLLKKLPKFEAPPQWFIMWGDKSIDEVVDILERVQSIKNYQKLFNVYVN